MRRLLLAVAVLVMAGCSMRAAPPAPDPAKPGGYSVGATTRTFTRTTPRGAPATFETTIWYPAQSGVADDIDPRTKGRIDAPGDATVAHPLLLWSVGSSGQPLDSSIFMSHLASHGFVVAGPTPFDRAASPSLRRVEDIEVSTESMLGLSSGQDPILRGMVDPQRIGIVGRSFGGYTTLKILETEPRLRAGLAMAPASVISPSPEPAKVSKPVMFLQGELDSMVPYAFTAAFYSAIPSTAPDHWLVLLHRAGHAFRDQCAQPFITVPCSEALPQDRINAIMARWGTAFLLRYVAGDERYTRLLDSSSETSEDYVVIQTKTASSPTPLPTVLPNRPGGAAVPTPTPSAPPGTLLISDDMSDSSSGKLQGAAGVYTGGEYVMRSQQPVGAVLPGVYADASIAADVRMLSPTETQTANLRCRSQNETSQYRFAIRPGAGLFQLLVLAVGQNAPLTGWRPSEAIRRAGETNHLELTCSGTTISGSINGVVAATVSDNAFRQGQVGIGQGVVLPGVPGVPAPTATIEAHFANLVVTQR